MSQIQLYGKDGMITASQGSLSAHTDLKVAGFFSEGQSTTSTVFVPVLDETFTLEADTPVVLHYQWQVQSFITTWPSVRLILDGEEITQDQPLVFAGNNTLSGGHREMTLAAGEHTILYEHRSIYTFYEITSRNICLLFLRTRTDA